MTDKINLDRLGKIVDKHLAVLRLAHDILKYFQIKT
jgi:hypothetical protein